MGKVTSAYPNPIQGISQQRDTQRLEGQVTDQVNFVPSLTEGVKRRNGTVLLDKLPNFVDSGIADTALFKQVEVSTRKLLLMFTSDNTTPLRIYDYTDEYNITEISRVDETLLLSPNPNYIKTTNPKDELVVEAVADTIFVINKNYDTAMNSLVEDRHPEDEALIFVKNSNYAHEYRVVVYYNGKGYVVTVNVADGSDPSHTAQAQPSYIAELIYNQLVAITDPDWADLVITWEANSDYVYLNGSAQTGTLSGEVEDGRDNSDVDFVHKRVEDVSDLPKVAPNGFGEIEVRNRADLGNSLYLIYSSAQGAWVETTKSGQQNLIDYGTMPHILYLDGGNLKYSAYQYFGRTVGDTDSNREPAFIGQPISNMRIFQNRLMFLTGDTVVFSRSGEFRDFWLETTQSLLDSDPISAFADTNRESSLVHSQELDGNLVLFGENNQFFIDGRTPLTPTTITLQRANQYKTFAEVAPVSTGGSIIFPTADQGYLHFLELTTVNLVNKQEAIDITAQVGQWIDSVTDSPEILEANNEYVIYKGRNSDALYVYNFLVYGNQVVQRAWHNWQIAGTFSIRKAKRPVNLLPNYVDISAGFSILKYWFAKDRLYFVMKFPDDTVALEYMSLGDEEEFQRVACIDHATEITGANAGSTPNNERLFTAANPYGVTQEIVSLRSFGFAGSQKLWSETEPAEYSALDLTYIELDADLDDPVDFYGVKYVVGLSYSSSLVLSEPFVKDFKGLPQQIDTLMVGRAFMRYFGVGDVTVMVEHRTLAPRATTNVGLPDSDDYYNATSLDREPSRQSFQVPVRHNAKDFKLNILTNSPYPITLNEMEWAGQYQQRGRRI